jgi:O-antigen/teichoic acid export membrane protein
MFDKIKRLGTDTAIYGVSTIVGRFLNFLLVPFYTNVLVPGEYGIVAYVYSLIAFLNVVYAYGMESAYFKYTSTKEVGTAADNFSTPLIALTITSLFFSLVLTLLAPVIGPLIAVPEAQRSVIYYSSLIILFDTLALVPFASLRMDHRPKIFAAIKFTNIVINVAANLVLLLFYHMGVVGIFLSGLIASVATFLLLVPTILQYGRPVFSNDVFRAMLKFGLPYLPAGLAAMMIQVVDRPILRQLTNDSVVGVYQANYRLGIFMMLIVSMYDYAWRPFFLSHAKEPDAKELFARILTYFVLFMSLVFLSLTFFIPDVVQFRIFGRYVIHPDYWSGLSIVPVVLFAYMFLGVSNNLVAGIYIEKKTERLPLITMMGAAVNIGANYLLIPLFGIMGAALATLFSYAAMACALYFVVQRFYPVKYEFDRITKIAIAGGVVFLLYYFVRLDSFEIVWKIGLLILFLALMYWMKFFEQSELKAIASSLARHRAGEIPPPVDDGFSGQK